MSELKPSCKWSVPEIPDLLHRNSLKVHKLTEGGIGPDEINYLIDFLRKETSIKTVLEIGFNSGISMYYKQKNGLIKSFQIVIC